MDAWGVPPVASPCGRALSRNAAHCVDPWRAAASTERDLAQTRRAERRKGLFKSGLFLSLLRRARDSYDAPPSNKPGTATGIERIDGDLAAMDATTTDRIDAESRGAPGIDPYAAIVDQLQHTVLQLVRATLEHARSDAAGAGRLVLPSIAALAPTRRSPTPPAPQGPAASLLSEREREVLQRIAAGDSNKMIARALSLSPHTVKRHVANILDKLGARTRSQAAAWLQRTH
jgi:DNA-binding CsgD family transcriptional regulator